MMFYFIVYKKDCLKALNGKDVITSGHCTLFSQIIHKIVLKDLQ